MNKNQIIETAYKTIKESIDWGIEDKSNTYGYWIDGVVTVVDNLLDKIKEENNCRLVEH